MTTTAVLPQTTGLTQPWLPITEPPTATTREPTFTKCNICGMVGAPMTSSSIPDPTMTAPCSSPQDLPRMPSQSTSRCTGTRMAAAFLRPTWQRPHTACDCGFTDRNTIPGPAPAGTFSTTTDSDGN